MHQPDLASSYSPDTSEEIASTSDSVYLYSTPPEYPDHENTENISMPPSGKRICKKSKTKKPEVLPEKIMNNVVNNTNGQDNTAKSAILFNGTNTFNWDEIEAMVTPVTVKRRKTTRVLEDFEIQQLLNSNHVTYRKKVNQIYNKRPFKRYLPYSKLPNSELGTVVESKADARNLQSHRRVLNSSLIAEAIFSNSCEENGKQPMESDNSDNHFTTRTEKVLSSKEVSPYLQSTSSLSHAESRTSGQYKTSTPVDLHSKTPPQRHVRFKSRISSIQWNRRQTVKESMDLVKSAYLQLDEINQPKNIQSLQSGESKCSELRNATVRRTVGSRIFFRHSKSVGHGIHNRSKPSTSNFKYDISKLNFSENNILDDTNEQVSESLEDSTSKNNLDKLTWEYNVQYNVRDDSINAIGLPPANENSEVYTTNEESFKSAGTSHSQLSSFGNNSDYQSLQSNQEGSVSQYFEAVENCDEMEQNNVSEEQFVFLPEVESISDSVVNDSVNQCVSGLNNVELLHCSLESKNECLQMQHHSREVNFEVMTSQKDSLDEQTEESSFISDIQEKTKVICNLLLSSSSESEFSGFSDDQLHLIEKNRPGREQPVLSLNEDKKSISSLPKTPVARSSNSKMTTNPISSLETCTESMISCFLDLSTPGPSSSKRFGLKQVIPDGLRCNLTEMTLGRQPTVVIRKLDELVYEAARHGPLTAQKKVMCLCGQKEPIPFRTYFSTRQLNSARKIGEGSYGEVFSMEKEEENSVAVKIIPVGGKTKVNGGLQLTFKDVLSEIMLSKQLHDLSKGKNYRTSNFIWLHRVSCVRGCYPKKLLSEWEAFKNSRGSENDNPEIFSKHQQYIILQFSFGGLDLEIYKLHSEAEAESIFLQVACALAVAEGSLEFEHRDLHWGNILVAPTSEADSKYVMNGLPLCVKTSGVSASIIDFSLSRMNSDGATIYKDLCKDPSLFTGKGDLQFTVYRKMKSHTKVYREGKRKW